MLGIVRPLLTKRPSANLLVSVLVAAGGIVAVLFLPWKDVWASVLHSEMRWCAVALLVCTASAPILATQWALFVPRQYGLSWKRTFQISAIATFARATLPFLAGDVSAAGVLVARGGLDPGAAVMVLTLDQLFGGVGKAVMVGLTLAMIPLPPAFSKGGTIVLLCVGGAFLLLTAAALYGTRLEKFAERLPVRATGLFQALAKTIAHLELLRSPRLICAALVLTTARKIVEIGVTLAVQRAVGIHLPVWSAVVFVTAVDIAAVIPGPPSGLGVFEAAALLIYRFLGIPPATAFVAAVLQHAIYLCCDFGYGYAVLALSRWRRPDAMDAVPPM